MLQRILDCLEKGLTEEAKMLLQEIENLGEFVDSSGLTLLHYSVKYGTAEITPYLISKGCDVNVKDEVGTTPLMLAVKDRDVKAVELLLKNNADIYLDDCEGICSLELAFCIRLDSFIVSLKQKSNLILAMIFDIVNDDFSNIRLTGLLPNANDVVKLAIVVCGSVEMIKFMLENCYSIIDYREPKESYTALHCAIMLARFESAKMLIENGANVDAIDANGWSPLYYYIAFEEVDEGSEVLKNLLRRSTTLSTPVRPWLTDLEYLLINGKKNTVETVLLSGIDIDACCKEGRSLLTLLIQNNNVEVLDLVDELYINLDETLSNDDGAVMGVAFSRCPKRIEFLLQRGADANMISSDWAWVPSNRPNMDEFLSKHPDEASNTAKVIELLLYYGADVQSVTSDEMLSLIERFPLCDKIILAHLTMLLDSKKQSFANLSCYRYKAKIMFEGDYYNLCMQQLDEMKNFRVSDTVTLYEILMTEKEEKIVAYARNPTLLSALRSAIENSSHLEPYYLNTLQRRISRGSDEVEFQRKAALAIEILTGLCADVYHSIVYKITSYLDRRDLRNLCQIVTVIR